VPWPLSGVKARALLARRQLPAARATAEEAYGALEKLGEIEEGESMVRLVYVEALAATGARPEACRALRIGYERLLARAQRIGEPTWRHRFLHDVPVNARMIALAEGWRDDMDRQTPATPPPDPAVTPPRPRATTNSNAIV